MGRLEHWAAITFGLTDVNWQQIFAFIGVLSVVIATAHTILMKTVVTPAIVSTITASITPVVERLVKLETKMQLMEQEMESRVREAEAAHKHFEAELRLLCGKP